MMWMAVAAVALGQTEFAAGMDRYLACLSQGLPSDLSGRDLETRTRVYRKAAAQCGRERQALVEAAVRERDPETSEAKARALAIDIVDTLDPLSSMRKH